MTTATKAKARSNGTAPVKPRDICLLGYAEETRDKVFELPASAEVWGINMAHAFTFKMKDGKWTQRDALKARTTQWFQVHPENWSSVGNPPTGYFGRPKEHLDFLQQFEGTVWLQSDEIAQRLQIPNGRAFPLHEIASAAGRLYFTSTFAYQLAMAWYEHVVQGKTIGTIQCFGINLTSLDEYTHQKPCVEYWLGRLEQAGVKVIIPAGSALLKGKLYARDDADLSDHAFERLQHWKQVYTKARDDHLVGNSMALELQFWTARLNTLVAKLIQKYPGIEHEDELKAEVQMWIDKRQKNLRVIVDRAAGDALKAHGVVSDNQHWLALTGGIDHRATALPEMVLPNTALGQDFDVPEARAI